MQKVLEMDYQAAISRAGQMINFSIITQLYVRIEVWKLRGSGNRALVAIRLVITTILLLLSITANIFPVNTTGLILVIYLYDPLKSHLRSKSDLYLNQISITSKSYPNQIRIRFISDPNQIQIRSKSGPSQIRTRLKPDLNQI